MPASAPHSVAMVAFSDAQILDVVGPLEVFSRAARLLSDEGRRGPSPYTVEILARSRGTIVTSSGIGLVVNRSFRQVRSGIDTLFVAGGRGVEAALHDHGLIRWLQRISQPSAGSPRSAPGHSSLQRPASSTASAPPPTGAAACAWPSAIRR